MMQKADILTDVLNGLFKALFFSALLHTNSVKSILLNHPSPAHSAIVPCW